MKKPKKKVITRERETHGYPIWKGEVMTIELDEYELLPVVCPDGVKRNAKVRYNIYGEETFLGWVNYTIKQEGKKNKRVRIHGWIKPDAKKKHYEFIPNQDCTYAFVFLKTLEELV